MTRNKKIGLGLIVIPIILIAVSLLWFGLTDVGRESGIAHTINGIFGILAVLGFIGLFFGAPVGVYFLLKGDNVMNKEQYIESLKTQEAYKNLTTEQIKFIASSSLGAFFATPVWALGNKLILEGLLSFVPILNLYYWIKLTGSGRKMAWEKGGWESFDQFKKRQKIMAWIVLTFFILSVVANIAELKSRTGYEPSGTRDIYGNTRLR